MLMNIFRLRVLKRFDISSRPQMSTEKAKNNRLRKQDDETKADISLLFLYFVADACQTALNAASLYSRVFLLFFFFFF